MNVTGATLIDSKTKWFVAAAILFFHSYDVSGYQSPDFPQIYNSETADNRSPMPAEDAARALQLPEGFTATVFASEPEVQNPIAMNWDARGRLWVAENFTYAERQKRFDLNLRDRVLILEDLDNDGVADRRKVFTDQVQRLTSVEVGHGGVWLMCPPNLLFIPDADGDDIPDGPAEVILDGFEIADGGYHNFANGLKWGPDGWLYGRCGHSCPAMIGPPGSSPKFRVPMDGGLWRYHPKHRLVEVLCHGTVNPWGHDWDQHGQLFFINTVIGHLWHMMPGMHFKESFGESMNPAVYERLDTIADHYHFDTRGRWSESRDGKANHLGGGHAHVGMAIYPAGHWPTKFHQRLFTLNMHGKRMNQETIEPQGAGYVGHHDADFLVSQDPFFRGMEISVGPDRNLFVADWSDTGECHEATGVHRTSGRIYKVAYPNANSTSLPFTKPLCLSANGPLQDLWKAHQNEELTVEQLHHRLEHSDEHVRAWAIRLLFDFWPLDTILGPKPDTRYPEAPATLAKLQNLAETDSSGIVLLTLASTLQRLPIDERLRIAEALVRREAYAEDPQLPGLVWYGLIPLGQHRPDLLVQLNRDCRWPKLNQWSARLLASQSEDHPEPFNSLLKLAMEREQEFQIEVIRGMTDGFRGRKKVTRPAQWPDFIKSEGARAMAQPTKRLSILFGEGREIEELRKMALTSSADTHARQNALECLIDADIKDLEEVCLELLATHPLNVTALKGLAKSDNPAVARSMIRRYPQFHPQDRPRVIETMVTRPEFARELLVRLGPGKDQIPATDLSAFHARQIQALNVPELDRKLSLAWGEVRETSKERREEMARWRNILKDDTVDQADLKAGEKVFQKNCSNCHRLYGKGNSVGPNLTGAQRGDLDYLLTNILDPSAIVGKDYRMTLVETTDGRLLSGLIVSDTPVLLVLQTASQKINIPREEIAVVQTTTSSSMPEGLLSHLSDQEAIDLIGYLMSGR